MMDNNMAVTKPTMYCKRCGYVLDGLDQHRCPECGRGFDPGNPKSFRDRPKGKWRMPNAAAFAGGVLVGMAVIGIASAIPYLAPMNISEHLIAAVFGPLILTAPPVTWLGAVIMNLFLFGMYGIAWRIANQIHMAIPLVAGIASLYGASYIWLIIQWW